MAESKKWKQQRVAKYIDEITNNEGSEANSYSPLKSLLTESACGICLPVKTVQVDTPLANLARPDFLIWLDGIPSELRNENEHLYAIFEGKPCDDVQENGDAIAREKLERYQRDGLRYYWQYDANVIWRIDLLEEGNASAPRVWRWEDLKQKSVFEECFTPLLDGRTALSAILRAFTEAESGPTIRKQASSPERRKKFVDTVVSAARIISRAVADLLDAKLKPDLQKALDLIQPVSDKYGSFHCDWTRSEYLSFENEPKHYPDFNIIYTYLLEDLLPFQYALRAETEHLHNIALRSGSNNPQAVSFLKNDKESQSAKEAFIQETSSLLLSRLLMIRFSEDHALLDRYLSNGGLKVFAQYAAHFRLPYQFLVRDAYDNAKLLYRHLFERKPLDWIVERKDNNFGHELLHAMWLLAKWDFKTVRGDILSGVYDKYLEPSQRKRLGEVYTRPELAQYLLASCKWDKDKTLLDPACGSGTFLVEAFECVARDARDAGVGFDMDDALRLLEKLCGLDLNEFSATLAKIQILWHVLSALSEEDAIRIGECIRRLNIEGGHSSLDTWGIPMRQEQLGGLERMENGANKSLRAYERRFRNISTYEKYYDIVIGNPPYVRTHRNSMDDKTKRQYAPILHKQLDLSGFFVYRALRWWLKDGGRMGFFLPLSLSESAYGNKIRAFVDKFRIIEIVDFELVGNTAFHGANIVTLALVVEKAPGSPDDDVTITTVSGACHVKDTDQIDMSKAQKLTLKRKNICLDRYLPAAPLEDTSTADHDEGEDQADSAWLTKVTQADIAILEKLARNPRIKHMVQVAYEKADNSRTRAADIPANESSKTWKKKLVMGYGVKVGGTIPNDSPGFPILKGGDVFPEEVQGQPMGSWNGGKENVDTLRFYGWSFLLDVTRCYAFREISLLPTAAPHPKDVYLQNTVYILQLNKPFPLNVWMLARPVQWFMAKTARSSVMSGSMRAHWFSRNLLRIPVPQSPLDHEVVNEVGQRLFHLDTEIERGADLLADYQDATKNLSDPLRERKDLIEAGILPRISDVSWPDAEADWTHAFVAEDEHGIVFGLEDGSSRQHYLPGMFAPTPTGRPCRLEITDQRLRRWVGRLAKDLLEEGKLPSLKWARALPVPRDLDQAIAVLNRIEQGTAIQELQQALDELDSIAGSALGLNSSDLSYIQDEMQNDPFLSKLSPAWKHLAGRRRKYVAYGSERSY